MSGEDVKRRLNAIVDEGAPGVIDARSRFEARQQAVQLAQSYKTPKATPPKGAA